MYTVWDVHVYKDLLELAGSSGAGRVISKLVTFAEAVLIVSSFFTYRWMKQLANAYFLALFIVLGNESAVWKYQEIRTI